LEAAIATLAEHRIGAVVVLGADRRVIGILSERDGSSPRAGFFRFML
jgi:CBS domain-containing protein